MAQFYGEMSGGRGTVSRTGTRNSGMRAHVRGWDVGVMVSAREERDGDTIRIYGTGGSNGATPTFEIGTVRIIDGAPVFEANADARWEQVR